MSMKTPLSRRRFVKSSAAAGAAAAVAFPSILHAKDTQKKIVVGVIGLSRGMGHVSKYIEASNCEVAYMCDVDERWNGPPPKCEPVYCPEPPAIRQGGMSLSTNSTAYQTVN